MALCVREDCFICGSVFYQLHLSESLYYWAMDSKSYLVFRPKEGIENAKVFSLLFSAAMLLLFVVGLAFVLTFS